MSIQWFMIYANATNANDKPSAVFRRSTFRLEITSVEGFKVAISPVDSFLVAVRVAITPTTATPQSSSFLLSGTVHITQIINTHKWF